MLTLTTAAPTGITLCPAGTIVAWAYGTWGSGTVTFTWSQTADGTFVKIGSGAALTANGTVSMTVPQGFLLATLSGSTGATISWNVGVAQSAGLAQA